MPQASSYTNPLRERFNDAFFRDLPKDAGVYFFLDENGEPLYIGKADCLKKRLMSYRIAKPGSVPDHTLEMIEAARSIRWEIHPSGSHALRRESELIRVVRPPFNIAGTEPIEYLMLGIHFPPRSQTLHGNVRVDFRLSHREIPDGFAVYGCFQHRGKTKAGYTALLRLFFASVSDRDRFFYFPARICQPYPPYLYSAEVPAAWLSPLDSFLAGRSDRLLKLITYRLLDKGNIPPFLYAPIGRDLATARAFFLSGPKTTRRLAKASRLSQPFIPQDLMEELITDEMKSRIREWDSEAESCDPLPRARAGG